MHKRSVKSSVLHLVGPIEYLSEGGHPSCNVFLFHGDSSSDMQTSIGEPGIFADVFVRMASPSYITVTVASSRRG